MNDVRFVAPSPRSDFVLLARTAKGQLYRKHILNKGPLIHPVTKKIIDINDEFVNTMRRNFDDGVCDIVQIPLAGDNNDHTEAPDRNIGEVVGIQEEGSKVYALMDIRKHAEDVGETILGTSAMFSLDYTDTRTGKRVGPTLLHACATNRPYVVGLDDYEKIVAASSDGNRENTVFLTVAPTKETPSMDLNELLETLLLDHGINVADLQAQATAGAAATKLSNALTTALKDANVVKLSNGEQITGEDIVGSVVELAETNVKLSARLEALEKKEVESAVDGLIAQGRILPAQRDTYIDIKLSNPELFDKLIPETPLIKLSHEAGFTPDDASLKGSALDEEVARLTAVAEGLGFVRN